MAGALYHMLSRRKPPAGPAGYLKPQGSFAAMHDRPTPQIQFDGGVRRGLAFGKGPLEVNLHPVMRYHPRRNVRN